MSEHIAQGSYIRSHTSGILYRLVEKLGSGASGQVWKCVDQSVKRKSLGDPTRPGILDRQDETEFRAIKICTGKVAEAVRNEVQVQRLAFEHAERYVPRFFEASAADVISREEYFNSSDQVPRQPAVDKSRVRRRRGMLGRLCSCGAPDDDTSVFIIVMEWINGENLLQLTNLNVGKAYDRGMPICAVRVVLHDLAIILKQLHRAGITHRDIKPANIMMTPSGHVYLCDFGVSSTSQRLTGCVGTMYYMAPEQAANFSSYTSACDMYALGGTAFHLWQGRPPLEKEFGRFVPIGPAAMDIVKNAVLTWPAPTPFPKIPTEEDHRRLNPTNDPRIRPTLDPRCDTPFAYRDANGEPMRHDDGRVMGVTGHVKPVIETAIYQCMQRDPAARLNAEALSENPDMQVTERERKAAYWTILYPEQ